MFKKNNFNIPIFGLYNNFQGWVLYISDHNKNSHLIQADSDLYPSDKDTQNTLIRPATALTSLFTPTGEADNKREPVPSLCYCTGDNMC